MRRLRQEANRGRFSIFSISCDFVLVLGAALILKGIQYIIWAVVISAFLQWAWAWFGIQKHRLTFSLANFTGFKDQLAYTIPLGLSLLIGVLSVQLDKLMISGFFKPEEFAVFSLGAMELPLIGILINSVNSILLPNLSGKDPAALSSLYRASVRKNAIIVFPLATVFFLFATEFMIFVYGTVYASAALYFRIYLLILPLRVATYGIVFQAMGKTRLVMIDSIIMLMLNAILNYFFIRLYGMKGAALATVAVSWLIVIVYLWQMRYSLQLKLWELFPPISLALNLVAAILPVLIIIPLSGMIDTHFLRMILGGSGYLVLYLILAYILRVIKDYDIRMLGEFLQGLVRRGNR